MGVTDNGETPSPKMVFFFSTMPCSVFLPELFFYNALSSNAVQWVLDLNSSSNQNNTKQKKGVLQIGCFGLETRSAVFPPLTSDA